MFTAISEPTVLTRKLQKEVHAYISSWESALEFWHSELSPGSSDFAIKSNNKYIDCYIYLCLFLIAHRSNTQYTGTVTEGLIVLKVPLIW